MTVPHGAPDPAAPAYLRATGAADPSMVTQLRAREALAEAVNRRLSAVLDEAFAEVGVTLLDERWQTERHSPDNIVRTVELPGAGRLDVILSPVVIEATTPPGWGRPAKFGRGQVIEHRSFEAQFAGSLVVLAVLGDREDTRPGYRVAPISRRTDGTWDTASLGRARTVGAHSLEGLSSAVANASVELPAGIA